MTISIRLKPNEILKLPAGCVKYERRIGDIYDFTALADAEPVRMTVNQFEQLIAEEKVTRPGERGVATRDAFIDDEMPPEVKDETLLEARTKRFYALRWDEDSANRKLRCRLSETSLEAFLARHRPLAEEEGFTWKISTGTMRDIVRIGSPGLRPLHLFLSRRGRHTKRKQHPFVEAAYREAEDFYWSARGWNLIDAYARFTTAYDRLVEGMPEAERPEKLGWEAFRKRLIRGENSERWTRKFGPAEAEARFAPDGKTISADFALEKVIIDHTLIDAWVGFDDDSGYPLGRMWLTLAIDVKTRMVLAIVLSFEEPSLYTIMEAVIQICRPKVDWRRLYPSVAHDFDGWGKPAEIIVDRAWAHTGKSFFDACADAGIKVTWAPIRRPQYKAIGERVYGMVNTKLWHRLPSGVPLKPDEMQLLGLTPAKRKGISREAALDLLHGVIVNDYSRAVHETLDAQPARIWEKEITELDGRPFADTARLRSALGAVDDALLTRSGIKFNNARFHDEAVTGALFEELAWMTPKTERRRFRLSSAKAKVKIKYSPVDFSHILIWVPATKERPGRYVKLKNSMPRLAAGMTFRDWDLLRAFRKADNDEYCSEDDWLRDRDALNRRIDEEFAHLKGVARKRAVRHRERDEGILRGGHVAELTAPASQNGLAPAHDLEFELGMEHRTGMAMPPKGPKRGGAKKRRASGVAKAERQSADEVADLLIGREPRATAASGTSAPAPKPATASAPTPPAATILTQTSAADVMAAARARLKKGWTP
jgi:putative transposase